MNQQGPSGMQSGGMGMQGPGNMNPQQMQVLVTSTFPFFRYLSDLY